MTLKIISITIVSTLIILSFNFTTGFPDKTSKEMERGQTFYVGGYGPNNYTQIQDAIDNASEGDTVFVFNGTYFEHVTVNKSINLI